MNSFLQADLHFVSVLMQYAIKLISYLQIVQQIMRPQ